MRPFAPPPRDAGAPWPKVSLIVAARDEEQDIEACTRSLLALDYPELELISVDDRSTDATGAILDRIAAADPRLRVLHVRELPPGWLGKNHALHLGASVASGELLLFTDADVEFAPDAIRGAVATFEAAQLDHLTLGPGMRLPGLGIAASVAYFARQIALLQRPWRAPSPRSGAHIGVGAFNLVRGTAYRGAGGHERIALRPDDDIKLGKILKEAGYRQELQNAPDALRVTWYGSVGEFVRGLEKNVLSGLDYHGALALACFAALLAFELLPWVVLVAGGPEARVAAAATIALSVAMLAAILFHLRGPVAACLLQPFAALVFIYACTRSIVLAYIRGGVYWRGTFYSLAELKRNRV
jgi:hypothetical protein